MIRVDEITSTDDLAREELIDLRELHELHARLRARTLCAYCDEPAHETPEGFIVHTEDDDANCYDENGLLDTGATLSDMLDADEVALLAELDRFDADEVNGDLHCAHAANSPTLIAESYWSTFAEEEADELVFSGGSGVGREFFDFDKWADSLRQDYTEVTLAGETFLRRA